MPIRSRRTRLSALGAGLALVLVAGCSGGSDQAGGESGGSGNEPGSSPSKVARTSDAKITSSIKPGARGVDLERNIRLDVTDGTFQKVVVRGPKGGIVKGRMKAGKTRWVSAARLQPDARYRITSTAVDADGLEKGFNAFFKTRELTLDEQTYASFVPTDGQTVGVGMPVIIRFDIPVTDKARFERHLKVTSQPAQPGSFHWLSDSEVHWRPRDYWQPGTEVNVVADIGGVPAGNGIFGQEDREMNFQVGRSMVTKVNMDTHTMKVFRDGQLVRTLPTTTGEEPKFTTRSGTKVIVEKFRRKRMNSETIGIDPNSADGYDLEKVEYAMRVTYSGEFIHAAPWSVAQQGRANVSHGCTGLSTANARWLYENTLIGDVVEYTGTNKGMTLENGYGDWNLDFGSYQSGSAL